MKNKKRFSELFPEPLRNVFFGVNGDNRDTCFPERRIINLANPQMDISSANAAIEIKSDGRVHITDLYSEDETKNFPHVNPVLVHGGIPELEDPSRDVALSFDLKINSMPISGYCYSSLDGCYGFQFMLTRGTARNSFMCGVQRMAEGFIFFIVGAGGRRFFSLPLDIECGASLKFDLLWSADGCLDCYINDLFVTSARNARMIRKRFNGVNALSFYWLRTGARPKSHGDDFDVELSDIRLCNIKKPSVLTALSDNCPFTGKGTPHKGGFILDRDMNSIVVDMGDSAEINRLTLKTDNPEGMGQLNKSFLSLYASDDNQSYTYIKDYSLLVRGNRAYFYNFSVEGRYLKLHSTYNDAYDSTGRIYGLASEMVSAEYSTSPLLSSGEFSKSAVLKLENNSSAEVCDRIFNLSLNEMGISAGDLKPDMADIRFVLGSLQLPHYRHGDAFSIRVPHMEAGETVSVNVLYSNENALDVSDGHEVFEVTAGTRFGAARTKDSGYWMDTVCEMPNGDILKMLVSRYEGKEWLSYFRSKDGGFTWSDIVRIDGTDAPNSDGGFIVDRERGKVFYFTYRFTYNPYVCKYFIYTSDDSGYTWQGPIMPENAPEYTISYSDGIVLSDADGEGPNVDYVFTTGIMKDTKTCAFSTTALYSKDGGKSWQFSDSVINFVDGDNDFMESGMSEETVWEQKNGDLLLYARCQLDSTVHFAKSHSHDRGVTWDDVSSKDFSNVYTSNTQPIIVPYKGQPLLFWGGNNSLGGRSYLRLPLNMARSFDDGESFRDILNVDFATAVATADITDGVSLHTNPDLTVYKRYGVDIAQIISTHHHMYVIDIESFLERTKGAYDSFEDGYEAEGWLVSYGNASVSELGATEGELALNIPADSCLSRTLHYIKGGRVSFDLTPISMGDGFSVELQTAFNNAEGVTAPIKFCTDSDGRLYARNGESEKLYTPFTLCEGRTAELAVDFDADKAEATLTLDGKSIAIPYDDCYEAVSYVGVFTRENTSVAIDRFIAVREK